MFIITDVIFGAILEFLKSVFTLTDKVETKFDKEISIKYEEKSKRKLWKTNNNRYLELNIYHSSKKTKKLILIYVILRKKRRNLKCL